MSAAKPISARALYKHKGRGHSPKISILRERNAVPKGEAFARRQENRQQSPSALAASSLCRPSTSTKRAPSARTRIGVCCPFSRMLAAMSFTRFCDYAKRGRGNPWNITAGLSQNRRGIGHRPREITGSNDRETPQRLLPAGWLFWLCVNGFDAEDLWPTAKSGSIGFVADGQEANAQIRRVSEAHLIE
jgi:hypothetical protein